MDWWIYGLVNLWTRWWMISSCIPVQKKGERRIIGCLVRNVWNFSTFLFISSKFQLSCLYLCNSQDGYILMLENWRSKELALGVTFEIKTDNYWNDFVNICHSNLKRGRYLFTIVQQLKVFKNVDNPPCLCQAWEGKSQVC